MHPNLEIDIVDHPGRRPGGNDDREGRELPRGGRSSCLLSLPEKPNIESRHSYRRRKLEGARVVGATQPTSQKGNRGRHEPVRCYLSRADSARKNSAGVAMRSDVR